MPGDPLPKTVRTGLGFSLGFEETYGNYKVKTIELQLANEANDLLIERTSAGNRKYQTAPGDINFFKNVIGGDSDKQVQIQNSLKLNIFEAVQVGFHKMKGPGFSQYVYNTSFMVSLSGILKVFTPDFYENAGQFFDIRYSACDIDAKNSPLDSTNYKSISLHLRNLFN